MRVENAGVVQDAQCLLPLDVELVARRTRERALPVRAQLRVDADVAQEAERAASDRGLAHVEVQRYLAAAAEVEPARGMEEAGQLGQAIAVRVRRDPRELAPQVFKE